MLDVKKIYSTNSGDLKITKYHNDRNVEVEFIETGYTTVTRGDNIRSGYVKDRFKPSVYGVGYMGDGSHTSAVKGKPTKAYSTWKKMLERCYCPKSLDRSPSYRDCSVTREWHNFQTFADWFEINYSEGCELDKDIKVKGNRIYSPEACCFVTHLENSVASHAKHYKFISPDGELVEIYNMREFCRDNNLNSGHMASVASGKLNQYKQWVKASTERVADFISASQAERNQLA